MVNIATDNRVYSSDYMLYVGMTREDLYIRCQGESEKAAKKLQKAFDRADGSCSCGRKDGVITVEEIDSYNCDLDFRRLAKTAGLIVGGGMALAIGIGTICCNSEEIGAFFKNMISKLKYSKFERDALRAFKK